MTFADWCAEPLADGSHRFAPPPLPALHPLTHGQFAVELEIAGGLIRDCRFDVHGSHRADEKLLEVRDFKQGLALINRHGWLTAPFAEYAYVRLLEAALGLAVSDRAVALRELVLALNTVAVEEFWTAVDGELHGTPASLDRRERVLEVLERITGARMHVTYVRIGGVSADVTADDLQVARELGDARITNAVERVAAANGEIAVSLPKVIRLPQGEYYEEVRTPHGNLGVWVFSRGDKVPHRVHLRTAGFAALATLEQDAIGMQPAAFFMRLATTRLVLGEVAR